MAARGPERPHLRHSDTNLTVADNRAARVLLRRLQRILDDGPAGYAAIDLSAHYGEGTTTATATSGSKARPTRIDGALERVYLRPFTRRAQLTEADEEFFETLLHVWRSASSRERFAATQCNGPKAGWTDELHDQVRLRHRNYRGTITPPKAFLGTESPTLRTAPNPPNTHPHQRYP